MSSHWQLHYVGTCATLLAVVAVLHVLCFAKVACDFEYKSSLQATNSISLPISMRGQQTYAWAIRPLSWTAR